MQDRHGVRTALLGGVAIEVVVEDGLDRAVGPGADIERPRRGRLDPVGAERLDQPHDAETGAEALFGMGSFFQDQIAKRRGRRPDRGGVAPDALDRPVGVAPMAGRHMLLHGRVLCGLCGERMGVRYSLEHGHTVPTYVCQETAVRRGGKICQTVPGKVVDAAVANLLIEMMTPMTLAVTLEVQRELAARITETDALRRQHVDPMRYEAELARRPYMLVDPANQGAS